jgi:hypothetical protein
MSSRVCASSAANGSSISSTSGSTASARQVHPLLHAAGQLVRIAALEARETDQIHQTLDALAILRGLATLQREAVGNVVGHVAPGQQRRRLKHHCALVADLRRVDAVAGDRAARDRVHPGQAMQQGRLAASAGADDRDELPVADREADPVEHAELLARPGVLEAERQILHVQLHAGRHPGAVEDALSLLFEGLRIGIDALMDAVAAREAAKFVRLQVTWTAFAGVLRRSIGRLHESSPPNIA